MSLSFHWPSKFNELYAAGRAFAMVTVVKSTGSTPRDVGARLLVTTDGSFFGTIGGGKLEDLVLEEARRVLKDGETTVSAYPLCFKTGQCCGGAVEVLIEPYHQGPQLYIFGAGHVGQAVCQTLAETPFALHLIDARSEWINATDLPPSVQRHQRSWRDMIVEIPWERHKTFAVVMTHSHADDEEIIAQICEKPARYLGLIGSEHKWARFRQRLTQRGICEDAQQRIHCPIGIGKIGKTPKEIAISFAAEILKELHAT